MTQDMPNPKTIMKYMGAIAPAYAMMAGMQLDIFTMLRDGAQTADEVANTLGVRADKLIILLRALVAAELLIYDDGKFANTDESAFYLVNDGKVSIGARHPFIAFLWDAMPHTAQTILKGEPQAHHDWHMKDIPPEMDGVTHAYHLGGLSSVEQFIAEIDLSGYKHIVDIGGGTGALAIGLTEVFPDLHVTIIDLPASIASAASYIQSVPQKDRIHLKEHNMLESPPDGTYEAAVLMSFTQVLSEQQNRLALRHTFEVLAEGGMIYIDAAVLDNEGITPASTAMFNIVFLNLYEGGQAYMESEYHEWLAEAGFVDIKRHITEDGSSIMIAKKPNP